MGIFDGCLIASDVDDTLVSNGVITKNNIEKIEFFMREGGKFSVATGRSANAISTVTSALKRFSPSVVANGCIIYDYQNDKVLYQEIIPCNDHKLLKAVIDAKLNVGCEIHSGINSYTLLKNNETDFHQEYEGFESPLCDFSQVDKLVWNKVIFLTEQISEYEKIKDLAIKLNISSNLIATGLYANNIKHDFLEVVPKNVSKATAVNKLCEILNIKKGCSYAIGDYYNDVPMLKNADISAATAGAPQDVKAVADYITVPCEEGAVADFIDYLTKINKK
ncbi:MAG: HAD-IIB family hydrolase [Ruminococcaceae bacterium]|nr:HAD-IIB family hydrolase [Oscillospiraceae bacterium]